MQRLVKTLDKRHDRARVLGIDPSSHSIDWTLVENGKPIKWGSLSFFRKGDIFSKLERVHPLLDVITDICGDITYAVVEETVLVKSPATFRMLSYMVGSLCTDLLNRGIDTSTVGVMEWKNYHGYQIVRAPAKRGKTAKEIEYMKKCQIQNKLLEAYPYFCNQSYDVSDSAGIALWGAGVSLK